MVTGLAGVHGETVLLNVEEVHRIEKGCARTPPPRELEPRVPALTHKQGNVTCNNADVSEI